MRRVILNKKFIIFAISVLMMLGICGFWIYNVLAANTAATNPGTATDSAATGTVAWSNPDNVKSSDDTYSTGVNNTITGILKTHYLKATNFGFSIPTGATITGIKIEIERKSDINATQLYVLDSEIKIVKADGAIGSASRASSTKWSTTEDYFSYGSPTDLWGETWMPADINDADFGVVLSANIRYYEAPCVSPDTKVETISGTKRIDEIKIGDEVFSYNGVTGALELKTVTAVWSSPISKANNTYFYIYYNNGQIIKATGDHSFYINGSYIRADELKTGDNLLAKDLKEYPIEKIETVVNTKDMVWDLTVEDNHNFFANGILVHNTTASVDNIRITVYYSEASGGATGYEMASTNYKIWESSMNSGGMDNQTSTSYRLRESIGEVATGDSTSTSYKLRSGYQPMLESYISLSVSTTSVQMLPVIGGVTGGTATGSFSATVITDNPAGYSLLVNASTTPAMKIGSYSFADYTLAITNIPDYTWSIVNSASEFGFSAEGTDISQIFKDNGSSCATSTQDTADKCWLGFATTTRQISQVYFANYPSGGATTIKLQGQAGSSRMQEPGTYQAQITTTAVAN